jgi:hypothetical protein
MAVDEHTSFVGFIKPADLVDHRRLAGARRADQRLSGLDNDKIDVMEDFLFLL